ncbi:MAG: helix-turn-helix transcriptional regulator [Ruminococcaceae bacterium]|nr:helix-turn-helix transcriptional regulator [Oscillospiraceae bacterium]
MKNIKLIVARTEKQMSQTELAEAIGITRQTVSLIEKGEYNPTLKLCKAICRTLGKTLNDIFWEEENEK